MALSGGGESTLLHQSEFKVIVRMLEHLVQINWLAASGIALGKDLAEPIQINLDDGAAFLYAVDFLFENGDLGISLCEQSAIMMERAEV